MSRFESTEIRATRVLVVDDSALMRKYLREIIESESEFEVHTARDGQDALLQIKGLNPDVVTLDINMPVMDGLTCLSHIMTETPRPVVMLSSLTEKGALATFEALEMGAVDYIAKPGGTVSHNIKEISIQLIEKIKAAATSNFRARQNQAGKSLQTEKTPGPGPVTKPIRCREAISFHGPSSGLVLIGVSTGGPGTLETILTQLPANFPWPILVAQHMPGSFTRVFAQRLDRICALEVKEADRPTPLERGVILIAKGDADVILGERLKRPVAQPVASDSIFVWHPSVERLVRSALRYFDSINMIGVMLTGMGYDGAEGMAEIHRKGGRTIAEAEETCIVFGMPKELISLGGADIVLPCQRIASQLVSWVEDKSLWIKAAN